MSETATSAIPVRETQARDSARLRRRSGVLHICNGLDPARDGGMVPSILGMTGALRDLGRSVAIATTTPSRLTLEERTALPWLHDPGVDLDAMVRSAEVVHLHGLWQTQTRSYARAALRAGTPYLVAAHGMADPWALRQKYWKKRIYLSLVEARNLRSAACLHALSRPEIEHLRDLAPWTPIAFIPNGVDLSRYDHLPPRTELEASHPELVGKTVILFFGRLHAKKGLDLLAHAFGRVAERYREAHLLLAGIDDGAWAPFKQEIESQGLQQRITYLGHVRGADARRVFAASDFFVLPSYSEGFSMAVLEAMACERACLISSACYFPQAVATGGAMVVEPRPESVAHGLDQMLACTAAERAEMGRRGRKLIEDQFTWERQAERLSQVYDWLAGGGQRPDCVTG